ncbi:hypothetical protein FNW02_11540 [Komarekiella sp. 'clone 1']|uniref:Uncharacterized protein n=1 Tax=Komarekiella delphini-convector SJRDD-AB1 TaxID=2593771 RepID=A0AA40VQM9_9NOST|nr:hypothetical protein [Komarekiella delphini-convector]MBD6616452.1 hypothetical protein [Komarekiella delphini-convector SJRDD-AB1]
MKLPYQCSGKIRSSLTNLNTNQRVKTGLGSSRFSPEFPLAIPPYRPSAAFEVTCNHSLPGTVCHDFYYFTWWCTYSAKGGLSNNPDGSVTCSIP